MKTIKRSSKGAHELCTTSNAGSFKRKYYGATPILYYFVTIICLITASVIRTSNAQRIDNHYWHPNTAILDEAAKYTDPVRGDAASTLEHDLKRFYESLRDKKWHETYILRAKAFQEDVQESDYLEEAEKHGKRWGLANYEILSDTFCNTIGSTNLDEAILICKFTELPDYTVSYSTVFWHKENGIWKCLSAGPINLRIFRGTRPPIIDWR